MKQDAIEATEKHRHKSTDFEVEQRVARVEEILRYKPIHKWKLLKKVQLEFNVSLRQAQEYCLRAKEKLCLHLDEIKKEHRATSLSVYESIINSSKSSNMDKVKAQNSIDELLGLKAPYQSQLQIDASVHATTQSEEPSFEEVSKYLDTDTLKKLLAAVRSAKKAKGIPCLGGNQSPTAPTRYAGPESLSKQLPAPTIEV
jgi:hypothetical protein